MIFYYLLSFILIILSYIIYHCLFCGVCTYIKCSYIYIPLFKYVIIKNKFANSGLPLNISILCLIIINPICYKCNHIYCVNYTGRKYRTFCSHAYKRYNINAISVYLLISYFDNRKEKVNFIIGLTKQYGCVIRFRNVYTSSGQTLLR